MMARLCCKRAYAVVVLPGYTATLYAPYARGRSGLEEMCSALFNRQNTVLMCCADDLHAGGGDEVWLGCGTRNE